VVLYSRFGKIQDYCKTLPPSESRFFSNHLELLLTPSIIRIIKRLIRIEYFSCKYIIIFDFFNVIRRVSWVLSSRNSYGKHENGASRIEVFL
jgi:hypothetical protein